MNYMFDEKCHFLLNCSFISELISLKFPFIRFVQPALRHTSFLQWIDYHCVNGEAP